MVTRTCSLDSQRAFMRDRPLIIKRGLSKPSEGANTGLHTTGYCRGNYPRYPLFPLYGGAP